MLEEKLQKFGLSQKEASVYTALHRLGASVVSDIAKKSGTNRSTAYVLLDALAKRGLVSISERGGIRVYSPAPAERLVHIAEDSLREANKLIAAGHELFNELKTRTHGTESRPSVQMFEGIEGIKAVYDTMLVRNAQVRSYSAISAVHEALPDFLPDYHKRQRARRVRVRILVPDTPLNREIITNDLEDSREYFLVPSDGYASDLIVSGNKIAFISFDEPSALIIENARFATLQKTLFDAFLTHARRWNVKPEVRKSKSTRKHPALIKATKRFFSA